MWTTFIPILLIGTFATLVITLHRRSTRFYRQLNAANDRLDLFNVALAKLSKGSWTTPCTGWTSEHGRASLALSTQYMGCCVVDLVLTAAEYPKVVASSYKAVLLSWNFLNEGDPAAVAGAFWRVIQSTLPHLTSDEAAWEYTERLYSAKLANMSLPMFFDLPVPGAAASA